MSRKTLPRISVAPHVGDEYDLKKDDLFPRNQHPDDRTVAEWKKDCEKRTFERKYGPIHDGRKHSWITQRIINH